MPGTQENVDLTRNSSIRAATSGVRRKIAEVIYTHTPIRANALSIISAGGNILGSKLASVKQEAIIGDRKEAAGPAALIFLAVLDGIDGELGRVEDEQNPEQRNHTVGMLVDVLSDRLQEKLAAEFREEAARKRGDKAGELMAKGAKKTNTLPSTLRAVSEGLGHPVPESGTGVFGAVGTRTGRAALSLLAAILPEHQAKIDFAMTISNIAVAGQRGISIFNNKDAASVLPPEVRKEGWIRAGALFTCEIFTTAATVYTSRIQKEK